MVGRQAIGAGKIRPAGVLVAEQPGFGRAPDTAVGGADGKSKDAGAERAVKRPISAPSLAIEDADSVIERAKPDAPGFVAGKRISVVVAEAVFYSEMGVLLADGSGRIKAPDALVFGSDPSLAGIVSAKGSDELALGVCVPRGGRGVGTGKGKCSRQKEAVNQRDKAGAIRRAR